MHVRHPRFGMNEYACVHYVTHRAIPRGDWASIRSRNVMTGSPIVEAMVPPLNLLVATAPYGLCFVRLGLREVRTAVIRPLLLPPLHGGNCSRSSVMGMHVGSGIKHRYAAMVFRTARCEREREIYAREGAGFWRRCAIPLPPLHEMLRRELPAFFSHP